MSFNLNEYGGFNKGVGAHGWDQYEAAPQKQIHKYTVHP